MGAVRDIITIDESRCNGCGLCVPNCPEGALQIIDGKARLVSDLFCDGLGACLGHCPQGAITVIKREAEPYDERKVMEVIVPQGPNTIAAHLAHLKGHGALEYYAAALAYLKEKNIPIPASEPTPCAGHSCPGSAVRDFGAKHPEAPAARAEANSDRPSALRQWPVQLTLVPVSAPFFAGADIVFAADCVPFAYPSFHERFLAGKVLLVGCPKLDDAPRYVDKLAAIIRGNDIRSITTVHMEVPCCFGLNRIVQAAIAASGKSVPVADVEISIQGEIKR